MIERSASRLHLELVAGILPMTGLAFVFGALTGAAWMVMLLALGLYTLLAAGLATVQLNQLGWPNRITLMRAMLVAVLAAALIDPMLYIEAGWLIATMALVALVLDGLDGWLARVLDQESEFGARFDMEVDAALILVLCLGLVLSGQVGVWALAIGLMRYGFVAAMLILPWLDAPLPKSVRRKLVCVWQVASLVLATTPWLGSTATVLVLASALALLILSFAVDIAWLRRQRFSHSNPSWRMS